MKRINETQLKGKKGFCCGRDFDGILCGEIASPTEKILCDACFDKINDTDDPQDKLDEDNDGICKCRHHSKDHSYDYPSVLDDDRLNCDICSCENYEFNRFPKNVDDTKSEPSEKGFTTSMNRKVCYEAGYNQAVKDIQDIQNELEELKETYDIAMQEIARLRKKLGYDTNQNNHEVNSPTDQRGSSGLSVNPIPSEDVKPEKDVPMYYTCKCGHRKYKHLIIGLLTGGCNICDCKCFTLQDKKVLEGCGKEEIYRVSGKWLSCGEKYKEELPRYCNNCEKQRRKR